MVSKKFLQSVSLSLAIALGFATTSSSFAISKSDVGNAALVVSGVALTGASVMGLNIARKELNKLSRVQGAHIGTHMAACANLFLGALSTCGLISGAHSIYAGIIASPSSIHATSHPVVLTAQLAGNAALTASGLVITGISAACTLGLILESLFTAEYIILKREKNKKEKLKELLTHLLFIGVPTAFGLISGLHSLDAGTTGAYHAGNRLINKLSLRKK